MLLHSLLLALYLQGGVAVYKPLDAPTRFDYWAHDINVTSNPYGTLELGLQTDYSSNLHFEIAARHASSIATREDHGINSLEIRVRYSPFRS